jgi:hypothetical protein
MVSGSSQQLLVVWVAAHDPVQDHQVGRLHRPGVLGEIVDAPVDAPLDPCLPGERARMFLVCGESSRFRARAAPAFRSSISISPTPPPISRTLASSMPSARRNSTIVRAVLSSPCLLYRLASRRANRWLKKRR